MLIWFGWDKPSCCIVQFGHIAVLLLQVWRAAGMSPDLSLRGNIVSLRTFPGKNWEGEWFVKSSDLWRDPAWS